MLSRPRVRHYDEQYIASRMRVKSSKILLNTSHLHRGGGLSMGLTATFCEADIAVNDGGKFARIEELRA